MKSLKKKSIHHKKKYEKIELDIHIQGKLDNTNFDEFIGRTVTVYVNSGGLAGNGFTGVLIGKEDTYIRLLIMPATPPACSLNSECFAKSSNTLLCISCPFNDNVTVGAIAEILISSIVAFVHNNI